MIFVVDSNVLFTFFWKDSAFEGIVSKEIKLFSPEFALKEINKHSSEIMKKSGLTETEFKKKKEELPKRVKFISLEEYSDFLKQAELLAKNLSETEKSELLKDIDFLALALKLCCSIWTNDNLFKKQSEISIFTTKEMIELLS